MAPSNQSFLKRRMTLKKKARELSLLCGVDVCMVCFGPDGSVETWPESASEVKELIKKTYPKIGGGKVRDLTGFLEAEKKKLEGKKHKAIIEEGVLADQALDGLSEESLMELRNALNSKISALKERKERVPMMSSYYSDLLMGKITSCDDFPYGSPLGLMAPDPEVALQSSTWPQLGSEIIPNPTDCGYSGFVEPQPLCSYRSSDWLRSGERNCLDYHLG